MRTAYRNITIQKLQNKQKNYKIIKLINNAHIYITWSAHDEPYIRSAYEIIVSSKPQSHMR